MESWISLKPHFYAFPSFSSIPPTQLNTYRKNSLFTVSVRAQMDPNEDSATIATSGESVVETLKVKEWEVGIFHNEVAATQGIRIRRRPPTGPPNHYVGPFQFRLQNEGNTPRNILEEIVWNKDKEVSQLKERNPLSPTFSSLHEQHHHHFRFPSQTETAALCSIAAPTVHLHLHHHYYLD
ncbi:hypothetical protein RYX36_018144 [Vicia faba]